MDRSFSRNLSRARWRRRALTLAAVAAGLLVYSAKIDAAPVHDRIARELYAVAGSWFELDCTYAARGGAQAVAYPAWRGLPPIAYARPAVCHAANAYARSGRVTSAAALGLLVLVHEAQHIAGVLDEAEAECLALRAVASVAERVWSGTGGRMGELAAVHHAALVARWPAYGGDC